MCRHRDSVAPLSLLLLLLLQSPARAQDVKPPEVQLLGGGWNPNGGILEQKTEPAGGFLRDEDKGEGVVLPCGARVPPAPPQAPYEPLWPPIPPSAPDGPARPPRPPPAFCPRIPPYPGLSSIQVIPCDVEYPQPDVCSLGILNGARLRLTPGQVIAVQYDNLASGTAQLSRLLLSAERLSFSAEYILNDFTAPSALIFLASGLCPGPGTDALAACLHDVYHGVPLYRGCRGCFGMGVVRELGSPAEGTGVWSGEAAGLGDTSYYRAQLPPDAPSLLYFLASLSSHSVDLSYARAARLLYTPGTAARFQPPSNLTFGNITSNSTSSSNGTGIGDTALPFNGSSSSSGLVGGGVESVELRVPGPPGNGTGGGGGATDPDKALEGAAGGSGAGGGLSKEVSSGAAVGASTPRASLLLVVALAAILASSCVGGAGRGSRLL